MVDSKSSSGQTRRYPIPFPFRSQIRFLQTKHYTNFKWGYPFVKQASMVGFRDCLIPIPHMLVIAPGNTGRKPGSSSAIGVADVDRGFAGSRYSGRPGNGPWPVE